MKATSLVVTVMAATGFVAAQPTTKGKTVNVQIIVSSHPDNEAACAKGNMSPTTVLIDGTEVHHCVAGKLLTHSAAEEKKAPDDFQKTLVQLAAGDTIRWSSNQPFRVVDVRRHPGDIAAGAPHYPFLEPLPQAFTKTVTAGPVLDLSYSVVQRYKVTFEVGKPGNRFDPDVVCSM